MHPRQLQKNAFTFFVSLLSSPRTNPPATVKTKPLKQYNTIQYCSLCIIG